MTEKEDKRIVTIMTNVFPEKESSLVLDEVFTVYNSYKHLFFKQSLTDKNLTEKTFAIIVVNSTEDGLVLSRKMLKE